jgi:hypothetical protein
MQTHQFSSSSRADVANDFAKFFDAIVIVGALQVFAINHEALCGELDKFVRRPTSGTGHLFRQHPLVDRYDRIEAVNRHGFSGLSNVHFLHIAQVFPRGSFMLVPASI